MKTVVAATLTALALLLAVAGQAQSQMQFQGQPQGPSRGQVQARPQARPGMPDQRGGIGRPGFMRPPFPTRTPSFVRPPFFGRHPFLFGSGFYWPSADTIPQQTYAYPDPVPVYVPYQVYNQPQPEYWAFCRSKQGYYPYVAECSEGWLPVLPTSAPPPIRAADGAEREPKKPAATAMPIEELRERIARSRAD